MRTLQQWADLTRSVCACESMGSRGGLTNEQVVDVVLACAETERRDGHAAVWHEMAQTLKIRCNCAQCLDYPGEEGAARYAELIAANNRKMKVA